MSASRLKLPTLLSSLPSNGKLALVRPSTYPPDSFYLVTRTRLRFSATPSLTTFSPDPATAKGKEKEVVAEVDPPVQAGGVKAHGKAWGMLFWKGKYHPPRIPTSLPDPEIRGGLKQPWQSIDPSSLSADAKSAVDAWKASHRSTMTARESLIKDRKKRSGVLSEVRKAEYEEGMEKREREREERMKVKILY